MSAVQNARALLTLFAASPWRDLHVRTGGVELFLAKANGAPNPMAAARETTQAPLSTSIRAPHLATVVSVEPHGTSITAGGTIAVIELLGERIDVLSPDGGTILSVDAAPGDLIEFDQLLATLTG